MSRLELVGLCRLTREAAPRCSVCGFPEDVLIVTLQTAPSLVSGWAILASLGGE